MARDDKYKNGEYRREYRQRAHVKAKGREDHVKHKYGITQKQYTEILKNQDNCCAICKRKDTGVKNQKWFHIDHEHTRLRVRGVLCKDCNTGLGMFQDNPELLITAAKYLLANEEFESEF